MLPASSQCSDANAAKQKMRSAGTGGHRSVTRELCSTRAVCAAGQMHMGPIGSRFDHPARRESLSALPASSQCSGVNAAKQKMRLCWGSLWRPVDFENMLERLLSISLALGFNILMVFTSLDEDGKFAALSRREQSRFWFLGGVFGK